MQVFGDKSCGLNVSKYSMSGQIAGVVDNKSFNVKVSGLSKYSNGIVTFVSGQNKGKKYDIKKCSDNRLIFVQQPYFSYRVWG